MLRLQQQSKTTRLRLLKEHIDLSACKAHAGCGDGEEVKEAVLDIECNRDTGGKTLTIVILHLSLTAVPMFTSKSRGAMMRWRWRTTVELSPELLAQSVHVQRVAISKQRSYVDIIIALLFITFTHC
jgi:hypothetical protein